MIESAEYTMQALAWLAVWSTGGLIVRQWLAEREHRRHDHSR